MVANKKDFWCRKLHNHLGIFIYFSILLLQSDTVSPIGKALCLYYKTWDFNKVYYYHYYTLLNSTKYKAVIRIGSNGWANQLTSHFISLFLILYLFAGKKQVSNGQNSRHFWETFFNVQNCLLNLSKDQNLFKKVLCDSYTL